MENVSKYNELLMTYVIAFGSKVLGAIALWVIGGWVITLAGGLTSKAMGARNVDPTLTRYTEAVVKVALRIALIIAILGVMGVETTSFAALLAAAGIAIGAAWSGLLANFAAGAFLMVLRPFKVGDMITAGGVTGDVLEIGVFATTLQTGDNVRVYVGNNKIFSDNIVNYSQNPYRRVDLSAQLAHGVDSGSAVLQMRREISAIPNVLTTPPPDIDVVGFTPSGALLAVRPYCDNKHYWQVFFDTNRAIERVARAAGWPTPAPVHVAVTRH